MEVTKHILFKETRWYKVLNTISSLGMKLNSSYNVC